MVMSRKANLLRRHEIRHCCGFVGKVWDINMKDVAANPLRIANVGQIDGSFHMGRHIPVFMAIQSKA
jgi:hypothetical protein